jgi:serine/threonine protein kinase
LRTAVDAAGFDLAGAEGAGVKPLAADDPRSLGEYRLHGRLGEGGMGRVYLGLSPAGRAVAIKVVHPKLAYDVDFSRRFRQEVASARAVSGIYTAPVVATGLDDDPPWLATAYVPGPSLAQVIHEHGALPESALRPLLAGLVEALRAIHECGVVHRDLKPANVLLAADGPRVIDFGISRAGETSTTTATGAMFGTPGYMSPEQAQGKPADRASDVFTLGCVMVYAATGRPPFGEGTAVSVLYRVVHTEPELDGLPPWLRELVARCLAKDPALRPTPQALVAAVPPVEQGAWPLTMSFWPRPVADLISSYQPRLQAQASQSAAADEDASTTYGVLVGTGQPPSALGHRDPQDEPGRPSGTDTHARVQDRYPPETGSDPVASRTDEPGYPRPGRADGHRARGRRPAPQSVVNAVKLMYGGAAYAVVFAICAILTIDGAGNPFTSITPKSEVVVATATCAIQVVLWLWIARACRRGRNWARIAATVFFALFTIVILVALFWYRHYAAGPAGIVLILVTWLIAGGSVRLLWQRQSSAFFQTRDRQRS